MTIKKSKGEIRDIRIVFVVNRLEAMHLEIVKQELKVESTGAALRRLVDDKLEQINREDEK